MQAYYLLRCQHALGPALAWTNFVVRTSQRDAADNFKPKLGNKCTFTVQFLEFCGWKMNSPVQHSVSPEREFSCFLGGQLCFADGFFKEKNLWVEVNTCETHGCPNCFPDCDEISSLLQKSYKEIFIDSKKRTEKLANRFNLEILWECELKEKYRSDPEFHRFCNHVCLTGTRISQKRLTEREILKKVEEGEIFDAMVCSVRVQIEQNTISSHQLFAEKLLISSKAAKKCMQSLNR